MKKSLLSGILVFATVCVCHSQPPSWEWAKSASGDSYDQSGAITTDTNGNVYVAGYFTSDSLVIGNITLRNAGLSFDDMFLAKYDPSGNLIWAQRAGGENNDRAYSMSTDKENNLYVTGNFYSQTIVFGNDTLHNKGNVGDIFIVKFNSAGKVLWAKSEGGPGVEIPYSLCLDNSANVITAGRFSSLNMTVGTTTLTQAGSMDIFVMKHDSAGNVLWAKGAGGSGNDEAYSVSTDLSGNIYLSGYANKNAKFGTFTLNNAGSADIFLAKYDPSGTFLWALSTGGNNNEHANALSTDDAGNSYVAGYFDSSEILFGTTTLTNTGGDNSFITKYDEEGNVIWAKSISGDSKVLAITHQNNQIYVCGTFSGSKLNFGSTELTINGHSDFYVACYDINGNEKWVTKQNSGGGSNEIANSIFVDKQNNIFIAGLFDSDPIAFGPSVISNSRTGFDMFLAVLGGSSTNVSAIASSVNLAIYPNPANGSFTIQFTPAISGEHNFSLYNLQGQKIQSKRQNLNSGKNNISMNAATVPKGIYLLQIEDSRGIRSSGKFVVE